MIHRPTNVKIILSKIIFLIYMPLSGVPGLGAGKLGKF